MSVKIYPAAKERLLDIWDYTETTWGVAQADKYVRGLVEVIHAVADKQVRWRPVTDAKMRGVFFVRYEHHYIFFRRLSEEALGVISILHENMDIPARLREDAERD